MQDLKAFVESSCDWLAVVLSRVELGDVRPEGLLDAYITLIPETDGDATPLGQRPLSVPPYCLSHLGFFKDGSA